MSKLPTNLQSIIHIINNWNFVYEDNKVKSTIEVHIEIDELKTLLEEFQTKLNGPDQLSDVERQSYIDAVNDLNLAISELESN